MYKSLTNFVKSEIVRLNLGPWLRGIFDCCLTLYLRRILFGGDRTKVRPRASARRKSVFALASGLTKMFFSRHSRGELDSPRVRTQLVRRVGSSESQAAQAETKDPFAGRRSVPAEPPSHGNQPFVRSRNPTRRGADSDPYRPRAGPRSARTKDRRRGSRVRPPFLLNIFCFSTNKRSRKKLSFTNRQRAPGVVQGGPRSSIPPKNLSERRVNGL